MSKLKIFAENYMKGKANTSANDNVDDYSSKQSELLQR